MSFNERFGQLLNDGILSVKGRQNKAMAEIQQQIADRVGLSSYTVQRWRKGEYPPDNPEVIEDLVRYCFLYGRVDRRWCQSFLRQARYPGPEKLLAELFPDPDLPANGSLSPSVTDASFELEPPEGAMLPASPFYVERPEDELVKKEIGREGVTFTLQGPRFMGKSSMLMRIEAEARSLKKQVAILDCRNFDRPALKEANTFFPQFCTWLTEEVEIEDRVEEYWRQPLGNVRHCTRYLGRHLLKQLNRPLVLALDNVDALFAATFSTDFFSMLRSWSDARARSTRPIWKQLDIVLVTSTEPYQFIKDLTLSPFNAGSIIELSDFTVEQVAHLNHLHGKPLTGHQVEQLWHLVAGHPYLVRRALYWIAGEGHLATELFARALDDHGPFGDHLRRHLRRLLKKPEQQEALKHVIEQEELANQTLFLRLQGAGLIRRGKKSRAALPRCPLYAAYFRERLHG